MQLKLLLAFFAFVCCNAQQRIPVISRRIGENYPQTIPSGNVRQFLSYPNVRRGSHEDALAIAAPYIRDQAIAAPYIRGHGVVVPAYEQLNRVATLGLTNGLTGGIALGAKAHNLGPVIAAILTHRTAEVIDVPTPPDVIQPQVLIVEPNLLPVTIEFRSQSSPVNIHQVHIPGPPGEFKQTRSEEEPDRVLHEVVKPVIQEVREIIQPFRKITQEILPVQEEVHSVVARGENKKVLQEVAIPAPAPIHISAVHAVGIAQPIAHLERRGGYALTGTVVRAGLIGGARVFEAPSDELSSGSHNTPVDTAQADPADGEPIAQATRRSDRKIRREIKSLNNRPSH